MKIIFVLFLFAFPIFLLAQSKNNLPPKKNYKKAIVTLTSFEKIECKNLTIYSDSLTFTNKSTGESQTVLMTEVGSLRVNSGNNALNLGLYGAISFACGAIVSMPSIPVILGFAAAGGVIGSVIGLTIPKTKLYRINY